MSFARKYSPAMQALDPSRKRPRRGDKVLEVSFADANTQSGGYKPWEECLLLFASNEEVLDNESTCDEDGIQDLASSQEEEDLAVEYTSSEREEEGEAMYDEDDSDLEDIMGTRLRKRRRLSSRGKSRPKYEDVSDTDNSSLGGDFKKMPHGRTRSFRLKLSSKRRSTYKNVLVDDKDSSVEGYSQRMPCRRTKSSNSKLSNDLSSRRHKDQKKSIATSDEMSVYNKVGGYDSSSSLSDVNDEREKEFEPFKIQKLLASRTELRSKWSHICLAMNTSALHCGSRWIQAFHTDDCSVDALEKRFLVKWSDLCYMHCSWETREDLIGHIENAKSALTAFRNKCDENGLVYSTDERCDGDYFHPAWIQVERVLEVHYPKEFPCKNVTKEDTIINSDLGIDLDMDGHCNNDGLGRQFLIKWGNRPYSESSYEFEKDLILRNIEYKSQLKAFARRNSREKVSKAHELQEKGEAEVRRLYKEFFGDNSDSKDVIGKIKEFQRSLESYTYKNGGQLRDYQAEGVAWILSNFLNQRNSILADEMGLGKTIQVAAFINVLSTQFYRRGPFLIVVPLSTLANWKRELDQWLDINTVVYHGTANDRAMIRKLEMAREFDRPTRAKSLYLKRCANKMEASKYGNPWMVEVVLTTPEMLCAEDYSELTAIKWEVLVVDEAHRLKNHKSKFAHNLRDGRFSFGHKIMLTGTPIQNTMEELFALLNFINPQLFDNCEEFMEKYGDMKSKGNIDELHEEIRPYILRRLKEDVEKSVPPKEETLIEVELTIEQKQYYRALYEKNVKFLHKNKKKALDGPSLNNLAMQLRKCCNHLFLLNGIEEEFRSQQSNSRTISSEGDLLVKASGKLVLLDKLLPRLKENGHRILIFSQFKIMLDILEDYLHDRRMQFERIDGSITGLQRQQAIDRFQAKDMAGGQEPFIMLLSTRAGGVGINLTAADTCIIFDSDWNPQNDVQAQARCHRIGQTKDVKVYRLLTRKTYEMQMFHISSLKMGLDQAVLSGFGSGSSQEASLTKEQIECLLKCGAYDIFSEEKSGVSEVESNAFIQQDIDTILERRTKVIVHENTGSASSAGGGTFSKASFRATKGSGIVSNNPNVDVDISDPDFWKKMLGEAAIQDQKESLPDKRSRTVSNYCEAEYDKEFHTQFVGSDSEAVKAESENDALADDDDSFEQGEESEEEDEHDLNDFECPAVASPARQVMPQPPTPQDRQVGMPTVPMLQPEPLPASLPDLSFPGMQPTLLGMPPFAAAAYVRYLQQQQQLRK